LKGGVTRTDEAVKAGEAENPSYALSVISRKIGTGTRFNASIIDLEGGYTVMATSEQYANMSDGMYAMEFLARKLSGEEISKEERENRMRTIRTEISGAVRTVESAERARARAEATDKFLKSSGIAFSGWGGFGLVGTAVKRVKSNDGTGNLTINDVKYKQDIGAYGGAGIELRMYRYFGIQTGIIAVTDYAPYTPSGGEEQYAKLSFVQIPILARFNFNISDFLGEAVADDSMGLPISVFGGLGINAGVKVSNADSADPGKLGLIAGLEMGLSGRSFGVFTGYQYNGGLGSGSLTLNGASYGYTRNNHLIYFGAKYYLPFRK
jgi:hypothetical protein